MRSRVIRSNGLHSDRDAIVSTSIDITEQLIREIATRARLEPEEIEPDAHFLRDLGLSSLDLLGVLAFAETSFATNFPDEVLAELTTLNKLVGAIRAYQRGEVAAR